MDLHSIVDVLTVVSLGGGLVFAGVQWRTSRLESRRAAQIQVLRSFDSADIVRGFRLIVSLPAGLSTSEIEDRLGPAGLDLVWHWLVNMESLGVLVHDRFVDLRDVDQHSGGPVLLAYAKLRRHIDEVRVATGRDAMYEWFQWLAERIDELEREEGRIPAHVRERDWRP